jgi:hypothetical protein
MHPSVLSFSDHEILRQGMGIFLKLFDKDANRLLHEDREMYPLAAQNSLTVSSSIGAVYFAMSLLLYSLRRKDAGFTDDHRDLS